MSSRKDVPDCPKIPSHEDETDHGETVDQTTAQDARRRILRNIITGGTVGAGAALLPTKWSKPVVDSVLLPTHAQSSAVAFNGSGLIGNIITRNDPEENDPNGFAEFVRAVRNSVIPEAHAGIAENGGIGFRVPFLACISIRVGNLSSPESGALVTLNSNELGVDTGAGSLQDLQGAGITTNMGFVVVASTLTPGGGGNGTINGVPFELSGGACTPMDSGESPMQNGGQPGA